ncbi:MAG: flagellar protein FliS [Rubripirellula sp.]|jgi:flagellar protein FliS|nr:flagellar protein FliS [Rubripirellula sp.]
MNFGDGRIARRDGATGGEQYLESVVRTATPARLRLMLIERAVGVADSLAESWRSEPGTGANELSLKLFELLNELLRGVVGSKQGDGEEVCEKVADLYVFLMKHMLAAEEGSDVLSIEEISAVLQVEAETWRLACANEMPGHQSRQSSEASGGGLNLEA